MVREGAVPRLTEVERQRKRHRSRRSAETRQHFTTKPPATDTTTCTTTPPDVATYVRAGALVPPPPRLGGGITRVGPGQYPQYTRALARSVTTRQPKRDNRRAQQSSRDDEVPHGSGALMCPVHILKPCPSHDVNESVAYSEKHPVLKFDCNNSKRLVVSAFKNPVSWLESLCVKGR